MDQSIARENMVKSQIRPNQVDDEAVLAALSEMPRESFLPSDLKGVAYSDGSLQVGGGRFMMAPLVLARLLQLATVEKDDAVLVIGAATGYSSAVLAQLASAVVAVEVDQKLAEKSTETLLEMNIDTVAVVEGDLRSGNAKQAPFDVIFFEGAIEDVPDEIVDQLAEGGRLVAVMRGASGNGRGTLVTRKNGIVSRRDVFDANLPFLPGFEPKPVFEF
ncbi:MAG: protein-L-isoaspartate O-methyltransferase [Rhodospirillales bacterium]|nr:protein-L-isoaspartate O-methyltransferase [Rhodospirillales bacterium]